MNASELSKNRVRELLPERPEDAHKGTFGHLFVIAGSRGLTGAAKMTGEAAARAGCGLVTVGIAESLKDVVGAGLLEVMQVLLPGTPAETIAAEAVEPALSFARDKDAVAIGPGLSMHVNAQVFVREFIAACTVPMVVDADGLNALQGHTDLLRELDQQCILTPHPGEMARLLNCSTADVLASRESVAHEFAKDHGCVVVLKGHRTLIAAPDGQLFINPTGNSGMGSGGTGDVLTGVLGSLLAQGMAALDAACLGVYLHGLAGDLAAAAMTERALIARDLLNALPRAWRILEGEPSI